MLTTLIIRAAIAVTLPILFVVVLIQPGPVARAAPDLKLIQAYSGFSEPVFVTAVPDGSGRLFVVERAGVIRVIVNGQVQSTPFLDLQTLVKSSGGEQGLLGLAFAPNYASDGRFFVYYTAKSTPNGGVGDNTLASYRRSTTDQNRADPSSASILLAVTDPFSNHNGGMLAFGPDGFLYVSLGDGGSAGDPNDYAQNRNVLLGKILRLDVLGGTPYQVPSSNPFVGQSNVRTEIWAYGLRNGWRFSFDRSNDDLWVADVGQNRFEEVNRQPGNSNGGENYGWRIMEGLQCFNPSSGCSQSGLVLPVAEYDHSQGECSVTGGYVYRGARIPDLVGAYVFGDFCSGRIWSLRQQSGNWTRELLLDTNLGISSFGEDQAGELYVADTNGGGIYRLVNSAIGGRGFGVTPATNSIRLSWTGGTAQTAYYLARSPNAIWQIAGADTSFTDTGPASGLDCYVLFPFDPSGLLGQSDLLCGQLGVRSASGVPGNFTLRLNQSANASMTWTAPGGQNGYRLVALPLDGRPARLTTLGSGAISATDATGGSFTCYLLVATFPTTTGQSDLACGLPGTAQVSTLATASGSGDAAARSGETARPETAARQAAEPLAEKAKAAQKRLAEALREGLRKVEQELKDDSRSDQPRATPEKTRPKNQQ